MKYIDFLNKKRYSRNVVIPQLKNLGYKKKAERLEDCGNYKNLAICTTCGRTHFNGATSCKDRFCPVCQKKRGLLWLLKIYPILENLIKKGFIINFVTLTVRDGKNLQERVNILNSSFRYMQHEDKYLRQEFNSLYIGGIRCLEVKLGKFSNLWHPHMHMLVVKRAKTDFREDREFLTSAWAKSLTQVTGIFTMPKDVIIDIKAISMKDRYGNKIFNKTAIFKACLETFKYLIKADFNECLCSELIKVLAKTKTINAWGNIRDLLGERNIDLQIEKELNMCETELSNKVCSLCGSDNFIYINKVGVYGEKIYDLKEKESQ